MAGRMLEFPAATACRPRLALNLERDSVGAVILGEYEHISEGDTVKCTGRILEVPVGPELIGRVVNALGQPIDGKGPINAKMTDVIEGRAGRDRAQVGEPAGADRPEVDRLDGADRPRPARADHRRPPDRQDRGGVDTIINQKGPEHDLHLRRDRPEGVVDRQERGAQALEHGAMDYTIVVAASASESAAMRYIARRTPGCTMGEYFRDNGRRLIIYDDLSKQAVAYRQCRCCCAARRAAKRTPATCSIYPQPPARARARDQRRLRRGLHQGRGQGQDRLADRAADHRDAGRRRVRVRADQRDLDHRRPDLPRDRPVQRRHPPPAINAGISVSRVGGAAQIKAGIKGLSGGIRRPRAVPRKLAAFAQFASTSTPPPASSSTAAPRHRNC